MKKWILMGMVGLMVMLLAVTSHAALIYGSIAFGANASPGLTGGGDLSVNTGFTFPASANAQVALVGTSGDFTTSYPGGTTSSILQFRI